MAPRWFLFMVMVPWYGFAKLIPTQFSHPRMDSLMMRWDESSMMGVVWRFMGLSMPYTIFSGAAEVLGGILLVWRKTSTLGALVVLAVMTNVAFLNYCYDVPVKLYSSHYLVMAMGLAWLDRDRLIGFFFRNRDVAPRAFGPFLGTRFTDRAATVFKVLLVLWACWLDLSSSLKMREQMKERFSSAPLHGIFDVEAFRRDGVEVAPLTTDATRWRNLILEFKNSATVRMTNDAFVRYGFKADTETKTVVLTRSLGPDQPVVTDKLLWSTPEPDVLLFEGTLDGKPVSIKARKRDLSKAPEYTLHNPGFRWVAEFPYNR